MTGSTAFRLWLVTTGAAIVALMLAPRDAQPENAAPVADVVFARSGEIYVRSADGAVRRITRNRVFDGVPSWSPDRRRIVFVRAGGNDSDIWVMNADGSGARRLRAARGQDLYPRFSPDGELIVFSSDRGGRQPEIYVMLADGTGVRRLTRTARHVENIQPSFSPDGRHIVFASNRIAYWNFEIFRIRASDGGGLKRLTFWGTGGDGEPGDDISPAYSPDGRRIAFVSDRDGGYAVWTMDASGRGLREVARHPGHNVVFPRFSADGQRLLYTAFGQDPQTSGRERLWTVRADGSGRAELGRGGAGDW